MRSARRRAWGRGCALGAVFAWLCGAACGGAEAPGRSTALTEVASLRNARPAQAEPRARVEWRFDPQTPVGRYEVAALGVRRERLLGRTQGAVSLLRLQRDGALGPSDRVHAVVIRARVSAGSELQVRLQRSFDGDYAAVASGADAAFWGYRGALVPGEMHTYVIAAEPNPTHTIDTRHIFIRPSDEPGARFEIESVRVVFRREHLAGLKSERVWYGLGEVWHDALMARSGETWEADVPIDRGARLYVALGTVDEGAVTFRVSAQRAGADAISLLQRTVTTPDRWNPVSVNLDAFAGSTVRLRLSLEADESSTRGLFGSPGVRVPMSDDDPRPQVVLLIVADTLRADHLEAFGYRRATAPNLARVAEEGAVFRDALAQGSWTKTSIPSILTSLYPASHGVLRLRDRLADQAVTAAELFRAAGYATLGYSSVYFSGGFSNLQQGFDEFHEAGSLVDDGFITKSARAYVDRLLRYLDGHPHVPVFAMLHVFDPHNPFEPRRPYATLWADGNQREAHATVLQRTRPLMRDAGRSLAPSEEELRRAGADPRRYVEYEMDLYDGAIRGMDTELVRVFERLQGLGLEKRSVVAFTSDHGEEFHEHGYMFHGQSLYAELLQVPLIFWAPSRVPAGVRVDAAVQTVDILPTLLELAGLPRPDGLQGRSLTEYINPRVQEPLARHAFAEKPLDRSAHLARADVASVAIHSERWKLIHNTVRPEGVPEFELYDRVEDPFEHRNLADRSPDVVRRLSEGLDEWRALTNAARVPESDPASLTPAESDRLHALGYGD